MKKTLSTLLILTLVFIMTSCGAATLTGEPASFQNKDASVSIDVPSEKEDSWIINEETSKDILDITDKSGAVNIVLQCVSKAQMEPVADDLQKFEEYSTAATFAAYFENIETEAADIEVPEYMESSNAYTFTGSETEGLIAFMESDHCYYTFIVRTVTDGYALNEKVIAESILSIKELTKIAE